MKVTFAGRKTDGRDIARSSWKKVEAQRICVALVSAALMQGAKSPAEAGPVQLFTNQSLFDDCLTWKVDFESRGNGKPLVLQENYFYTGFQEEWRNQGVRIISESYFGPLVTGVFNWDNSLLETAIDIAGSGSNVFWEGRNRHIILELTSALPAFGFTTFHRSDRPFDIAYIYSRTGSLLRTVELDESLLTGRIEGETFGYDYDILFGFVGFNSPEDRIGRIWISNHSSSFDNLYIGIIPEPLTGVLFLVGAMYVLRLQTKTFNQ